MLSTIFQQLQDKPNGLLLTPNQRMATSLLTAYEAFQREQGKNVWETPRIMAYSAWQQENYQTALKQGNTDLVLLTPSQELLIWENIIHNSKWGDALLQSHACAKQAQQAYSRLSEWEIPLEHPGLQHTEYSESFLAWGKAFEKLCDKNKYLPPCCLGKLTQRGYQEKTLSLPAYIILMDFDEIAPHMKTLLQTLSALACEPQLIDSLSLKTKPQHIALGDTEEEIETMALWAYDLLKKGETEKIACVVPNLDQLRPTIVRVFSEVFKSIDTRRIHYPINISGGEPLTQQAMIKTAFLILGLSQYKTLISDLGRLFHSFYLKGAAHEMPQRAELDALLRKTSEPEITLGSLINQSYKTKTLRTALEAFYEVLHTLPKQQKPSEWATSFIKLLLCLGWPGDRALNSREFQIAERWEDLLIEFSKLDLVSSSMKRPEAIKQLKQLASQVIFQPKTDHTQVQVLGLLEAAGSQFKHLWIMNLNDEDWPPSPKPNPLLPVSLQRQYNMPHASSEKELAFCEQIMKRFYQSASHIVLSYPQQKEGREVSSSPLIADFPTIEKAALNLSEHIPIPDLLMEKNTLESLEDHYGEAINEPILKGGTGIIKQQSACPFKAFAEYRLHAKPLEIPAMGLTPLERGSLLHKVLEELWLRLSDQKTLLSLTNEALNDVIHASIDKGLSMINKPFALTQKLLAIEHERLSNIILEWLLIEKERAPFKVISAEKKVQIKIEDVAINATIDRIDELPNGKQLIIDYKTGNPTPLDWLGERPREPQLPLYASHHDKPITALAFAQLTAKEIRFKGISDLPDTLPNVKSFEKMNDERLATDWDQQFKSWKHSITDLMSEIKAGFAVVDPLNPTKDCQYCQLHNLCRIQDNDDL